MLTHLLQVSVQLPLLLDNGVDDLVREELVSALPPPDLLIVCLFILEASIMRVINSFFIIVRLVSDTFRSNCPIAWV